ncbi:hypothetical protein DR66_1293 [Delftia acidovorans]|uniref:hypothetical protein n=1 Tax=Delftia acidovorans TaxID=80866 RepID=UPI0005075994|nr:hypothetical protein [Delftia acidovorans]KFJ11527.1 hypothetical protein DR66_1293 [Delftia acidovorans]QQB51562.1 hypothetical protein I6H54_04610 [Delftia acidovorans]
MAALSLSLAGVALSRLRTSPDRARSKPLNVPASFASAAVPRTPAREAGDGSLHAQTAPVALLTRVSEGVRIVRRNDVIAAQAGAVLQQGDRVIVPQQGGAQAVFQEQDGQALLGSFAGGTDATLAYFSRKADACSVVFDLVAGHVDLALSAVDAGVLGGGPTGRGRRAIGFHCYSQPIAGR